MPSGVAAGAPASGALPSGSFATVSRPSSKPVTDLGPEETLLYDIKRCKENSPSVSHKSSHIVEEIGAIDWRNEVEVPTEEYYQALRADMAARHPGACSFVLDHLLS